jgi:hypothetical protein
MVGFQKPLSPKQIGHVLEKRGIRTSIPRLRPSPKRASTFSQGQRQHLNHSSSSNWLFSAKHDDQKLWLETWRSGGLDSYPVKVGQRHWSRGVPLASVVTSLPDTKLVSWSFMQYPV